MAGDLVLAQCYLVTTDTSFYLAGATSLAEPTLFTFLRKEGLSVTTILDSQRGAARMLLF